MWEHNITFENFREDGGSFGAYKKYVESEKALANKPKFVETLKNLVRQNKVLVSSSRMAQSELCERLF